MGSRRDLLSAFSGIVLATVLAALDQTIVATALPRIAGDRAAFDRLSWVVTAYLLAATITIPLYGKLSDLFGRRLLFTVAIWLFLAGSVLCAVAAVPVALGLVHVAVALDEVPLRSASDKQNLTQVRPLDTVWK